MLRSGIQSDDGPGCGFGVKGRTTLTGNSLINVDMRERVYFFNLNCQVKCKKSDLKCGIMRIGGMDLGL